MRNTDNIKGNETNVTDRKGFNKSLQTVFVAIVKSYSIKSQASFIKKTLKYHELFFHNRPEMLLQLLENGKVCPPIPHITVTRPQRRW